MGEERIDVKQLFYLALRYWNIFLVCFILIGAGTFYYLATTQPVYQATASLIIEDDENSGRMNAGTIFKELGIEGKNGNLENEITILT